MLGTVVKAKVGDLEEEIREDFCGGRGMIRLVLFRQLLGRGVIW